MAATSSPTSPASAVAPGVRPQPVLPARAEWLDPFPELRLRIHLGDDLVRDTAKQWRGPPVPNFVPHSDLDLELVLLDASPEGWFALYRTLFEPRASLDWQNSRYRARLFRPDGSIAWTVDLNAHFQRTDHIEIQDARFARGVLYYNEACQTYARDAQKLCSWLVAIDPQTNAVLWRTKPLVSNSRIVLLDENYLVTGYGFTDEPDNLSIVRRKDGAVVARARLASAPSGYALLKNRLIVRTYEGVERFRLSPLERTPRLRREPTPE